MQMKLVDEREVAPKRPKGSCLNFKDCENMTPGGSSTRNTLCTECIDDIRNNE